MFKLNIAALLYALAAILLSLPAVAETPYEKPDNSWISISGTVETVSRDSFLLDYGEGVISVEMDDGDRDADGYKLIRGDKVTVSGLVDDDFYETTTIEAGSVYVENIGTYFYVSAADEEEPVITVTGPVIISETIVQGTVTDVSNSEFTLDSGGRKLVVEVDEMPYNPLDDEGYQKVTEGDVVSVSGNIDRDLFEGRIFNAKALVTLSNGRS